MLHFKLMVSPVTQKKEVSMEMKVETKQSLRLKSKRLDAAVWIKYCNEAPLKRYEDG